MMTRTGLCLFSIRNVKGPAKRKTEYGTIRTESVRVRKSVSKRISKNAGQLRWKNGKMVNELRSIPKRAVSVPVDSVISAQASHVSLGSEACSEGEKNSGINVHRRRFLKVMVFGGFVLLGNKLLSPITGIFQGNDTENKNVPDGFRITKTSQGMKVLDQSGNTVLVFEK